MAEKAVTSAELNLLLLLRRYLREVSMRVTLSRPQDWQMDCAFAAQAVEKLSRGPTCIFGL